MLQMWNICLWITGRLKPFRQLKSPAAKGRRIIPSIRWIIARDHRAHRSSIGRFSLRWWCTPTALYTATCSYLRRSSLYIDLHDGFRRTTTSQARESWCVFLLFYCLRVHWQMPARACDMMLLFCGIVLAFSRPSCKSILSVDTTERVNNKTPQCAPCVATSPWIHPSLAWWCTSVKVEITWWCILLRYSRVRWKRRREHGAAKDQNQRFVTDEKSRKEARTK